MHETTMPVLARTPLRAALLLASIFVVLTFLIHLFSTFWGYHLGYGFHGDELYFLVCGHHLAWVTWISPHSSLCRLALPKCSSAFLPPGFASSASSRPA